MTLRPYSLPDRLEFGIDEAGRGALISRVYTGCVCWDPTYAHPLIRDSKKLTKHQREMAYDLITENAIAYATSYADVDEIEQYNILGATIRSMKRSIRECELIPDHLLIDGSYFTPYIDRDENIVSYETVVGGDDKFFSIAAGSILAKVEHDRHIAKLCIEDPTLLLYGIDKNMGYGAPIHMKAIEQYGITRHHRRGYAPCQRAISKRLIEKIDTVDVPDL